MVLVAKLIISIATWINKSKKYCNWEYYCSIALWRM